MSRSYLQGFGNHFSTEAEKDVLPVGRNSPQNLPHGLYAEQFTGSAFTAPRAQNKRSWAYRIRPSVQHGSFEKKINLESFVGADFTRFPAPPNQMRWNPSKEPKLKLNFVQSLTTLAGSGGPDAQTGLGVHLYACNQSMDDFVFYNADAEMMIVPESGTLEIKTEMGIMDVAPKEICVIPKGIRFSVLVSEFSRGYMCENFGSPFQLPDLGPIGANGLANPRDFQAPVAAYEKKDAPTQVWAKFLGEIWETQINHSPFDVVAWHGNYTPYKYNLEYFNTINTVSFDHPDPSIFTVLTSPSSEAGVANIDFVIFPPRWMVANDTFRPPYFHRNVMNELMGLIVGKYDAKEDGFAPGGASLHNCMSGHGPDADTFKKASQAELKPEYIDNTMAFMFESRYVFRTSPWAVDTPQRQRDYIDCWKDLEPAKL